MVKKMIPPLFLVDNHESFGFLSILSPKSVSDPGFIGFVWSGVGQALHAIYAAFSCFCYVGVFDNLTHPVVPTLRGASEDVVIAYAC